MHGIHEPGSLMQLAQLHTNFRSFNIPHFPKLLTCMACRGVRGWLNQIPFMQAAYVHAVPMGLYKAKNGMAIELNPPSGIVEKGEQCMQHMCAQAYHLRTNGLSQYSRWTEQQGGSFVSCAL